MSDHSIPCEHCGGAREYYVPHKCPAKSGGEPPLVLCKWVTGKRRVSPDGTRAVQVDVSTNEEYVQCVFENGIGSETPIITKVTLSKGAAQALAMLLMDVPGICAGHGSC